MTTPKRLDFSSPPRLVLVADDDDDDDAENNCPPLTRRTSQRQAAFKRPASSDAAVKEEEPMTKKKKQSVKIWNEDDELTILKGLVDYRSKESIDPSTDWDGFFSYVKGLMHVKVSKEQLLSKIRKLKKKFLVNMEKINNGEDPNFTKFTDPEAFKVSTVFWGENDVECSNAHQAKKSVEDDKENADADAEPVNDNEAAKTNRDDEPRHEKKSDGKEPHDNEPGNNNFDGEALQQLVDKKTFGKKMSHDNEAGNSKSDGKLLQQSTEKKTTGKKMSHDNEAGTSNADGKLVQQTVVDNSTENNTAAEESRDDDVCTVQEAFETMISQGLSEQQKKMQLEKLMNLETENRKELSNEWKEICSEETKLSAKKLRFSAKLVEAAIDG